MNNTLSDRGQSRGPVTADEIAWTPKPAPFHDIIVLADVVKRITPLSTIETAQYVLGLLHENAQLRETLRACMDALSAANRRGRTLA